MNLVIPIASISKFFSLEEYGYPKPLVEIAGVPMIEHVIKNITYGNSFKNIIFIVKQDECDQYHLDDTLSMLSPIKPEIIKLRSDTQGALCSVLLAIDYINNDEPLLISNADQIFERGFSDQINLFLASELDAACITFDSVHPRWSYVKTNEFGNVIETAEKKPISRNAIAGVYLYKKGSDFIQCGMTSIKNGSCVEGKFYIAPVFNEYVLMGKTVGCYTVQNEQYHTFYSARKIEEYESRLKLVVGGVS